MLLHPNSSMLKTISKPVTDFGITTNNIIRDMYGVMTSHNGIGLSAIQIGIPLQIITIDVGVVRDGKKSGVDYLCMVNPVITDTIRVSESEEEGCLSFPDFYQSVSRLTAVQVKYLNPENNFAEEEHKFEGLLARVIQHEMDHLKGKTIFDEASAMKRAHYLKKINKGR